ncbi:MAG: hypothetical protein U0838_06925 [Chloroflexota bacterium]
MTDPFADERLQFFLRNREDIKTWAAIEADVIAATRELLAGARVLLAERMAEVDAGALVTRRDGGSWERIVVQRPTWPETIGLTLEWNRSVDVFGASRPKIGVFWWAEPTTLVAPRTRFVGLLNQAGPRTLGYKVPLESVWPVGARVHATPDWWKDPEAWIGSIVETLVATWPLVAPKIDEALAVEPWASGG